MKTTFLLVVCSLLGACAAITPTYESEQAFVTYDIRPAAISKAQLMDAVSKAVRNNVSDATISRGIPPRPLPAEPAPIRLNSGIAASALGQLAASSGMGLATPTCDGAILNMRANKTSNLSSGQFTTFFACVVPYRDGYQVSMHSQYSRAKGGLSPQALGSALAIAMIGEQNQYIPKTMNEVKVALQKLQGARVTVVDSYVPEEFTGVFNPYPEGAFDADQATAHPAPVPTTPAPFSAAPATTATGAALEAVPGQPRPNAGASVPATTGNAHPMATNIRAGDQLVLATPLRVFNQPQAEAALAGQLTAGQSVSVLGSSRAAHGQWWFVSAGETSGWARETDISAKR